MQHIKKYDNTTIIDDDIDEIIIDDLKQPLDNIPPTVNKITVKESFNIYKRQNRIPYGCDMKKEDYLDITILNLTHNQITVIPELISSLHNLRELYLYDNKIIIISESIGLLENYVFQSSLIKIKDFY